MHSRAFSIFVAAAALAVSPLRAQAPRAPVFQNINAAQQGAFDRIDPVLGTAVIAARNDLTTASLGDAGGPAAGTAFPLNFAGSIRSAGTPEPQVVVINQGTNDSGASATVFEPAYLAFLQQIRTAYPRALIAAMRPFNGSQDATIYSAVQAMHDPRIIYLDTDGWLEVNSSPDYTEQPTGLHPSLTGHAKAAKLLTEALVAAGVPQP